MRWGWEEKRAEGWRENWKKRASMGERSRDVRICSVSFITVVDRKSGAESKGGVQQACINGRKDVLRIS